MITILLEKIKALLSELKTNIENIKSSIDYSETEREIGKWIDGTPLFEKTIVHKNITRLQNAQDYSTGITDNIKVVSFEGIIKASDKSYPVPFATAAGISILYNEASGYLVTKGNDTFDNVDLYITIRYIKVEEENT